MNQTLLEKLNLLKNALDNDERVILLNSLDKEISNNEEVMKLSYKKDVMVSEYEEASRHFSEGSKELEIAQKKLYEAKLVLDSHPLVVKYNKAYQEVRKLYENVNNELFKEFVKKDCNK